MQYTARPLGLLPLLKISWVQNYDIIIIGGGAAGFFTAINAAERLPDKRIAILERGKDVLNKVRISGGGRCNVTHAQFDPQELVKNYPRGAKELRGPFHKFMTGDAVAWFEQRGVELKTEEDGRMFPVTDSSQTIIDCFLQETHRLGVEVLTRQAVQDFSLKDTGWEIITKTDQFTASQLVVACGSNPKMWNLIKSLGHTIVTPVPSLFTFDVSDPRIKELPGISLEATVEVVGTNLTSQGALLITHWGLSGPAILRLSAWGARELSAMPSFEIRINWLNGSAVERVLSKLKENKILLARQHVRSSAPFSLPKRLWQSLCTASGILGEKRWADLSREQLNLLVEELTGGTYKVSGKSTFKEEFVTAGGVDLKEVDFRSFRSKVVPNLFLAGEVLNIDAITGGFNFQNAWTGGYLVAQAL